jgi:predicted transcriptional regulator
MRVPPHKKYRTRQFNWELASTYCRTAGHQLSRDGTNCFEEFHSTAIQIVVLSFDQNGAAACPQFPDRKMFVQLGSHSLCLVFFLRFLKIVLASQQSDSHPGDRRRYTQMAQTLLEMAKDLTRSLVETGRLSAENMQDVLQQTHTTLRALRGQEESGAATAVPVADASPVNWRKSISRHVITCLECGLAMKQLSIRHLGLHGLDGRSYRMKYAIPRTQPLAARSTTDRRRQVVRQTRPWEKAPTYRKRQARKGNRPPEPEAETVPEETEAPIVKAPTQAKRQRKTTSKKKASPKTTARGRPAVASIPDRVPPGDE